MKFLQSVCLLMLALSPVLTGKPASYDPLKIADVTIVSKPLAVHDAKRDREIPIRIYLPESQKPAPVVLFSHGLGGSRDNNPYLGNHWAKRGYAVVFIQHPGSDESVWKDVLPRERMAAMKQAASGASFMERIGDVSSIINALTEWNSEKGNPLSGRLDLKHIGMSGHSFGAVTTQAMAGQSAAGGRVSFADSRLTAAVMMSPSPPKTGDPNDAFAAIKIPCLLMTGTHDSSPIRDVEPTDRLKVFLGIRNAPAWQVVFDNLEHSDFGERGGSQEAKRYHKAILALTTAFWDAELKGDKRAIEWLNGKGATSVLAKEDKWEMNAKAKETP
jgi:dienelactone hydrolase